MRKFLLAAVAAPFLYVQPAVAVDGVFEISEVCAGFGCFTGDSGGFPVTITAPGSYRLTSNLVTGGTNTTLIEINANNVTLDLNGFALIGPATCTGTPVTSCSGTGSGFGVDINGDRATVHNGSIQGSGSACISATLSNTESRIYDLTLDQCGGDGIVISNGLISDVVISRSAANGVNTFLGVGFVKDSFIRGNGDFGQTGGFCTNNVYSGNSQAVQAACSSINNNICGGSAC